MKRTLLVLALAACAAAGCRAVGSHGGCGEPCMGSACRGPQPGGLRQTGCGDACTSGTCCEAIEGSGCCAGCDECGLFSRNWGGGNPGYPPATYDCSACGSPRWGNHGFCQQPGPGCTPGCPSGDQVYDFNAGPPVGQTAYPYYTVRGPRDFLRNNPPSIGPY
jgi:hypothetical protein